MLVNSSSLPLTMFTALAERKDLLMALTDRLGRIEWVNQAFVERTGLAANSLMGQKFFAVLGSHSQLNVQQAYIREQLLKGESFKFELSYQTHDERVCWLLVDGQPIHDAEGITSKYAVMSTDITLRKLTEQDLEQTRQRLKRLVENVKLVPWEAEGVTRQFTYVGPQATELFGYDLAQWYEPNFWYAHIHPEDLPQVIAHQENSIPEKNHYVIEYRFLSADGSWIWLKDIVNILLASSTIQKIKTEDNVTRFLGFLIDISDRKQTELSLQKVLYHLEQTNQELELRVQQRTVALTQEKEKLEQTLTELKKTQTQLIHSEKMSSLGQLVAGIAHEINNPVNFIYGNLIPATEYTENLLQLLQCYQQNYPDPNSQIQTAIADLEIEFIMEDLPKLLSSMNVGTNRIRDIVLSLRNFSRLDEAEVKEVDIHEGIDSTLMILQNRLKAKSNCPEIQVVKEYGELPLIECYAGQINQVFMNILANAIDVLEESIVNGEIVPSCRLASESNYLTRKGQQLMINHLELGNKPQIHISTRLSQEQQVLICIADNGPGMIEETRKRLFDPFFTTKPVGKGTGLGLSISYQIVVEKHQGKIECHSEVGRGTEFIISIPIKQSKQAIDVVKKI
ncbi:PAS domain S-box protein [Nostoc sp. TCL26-01]|uniref:PAS domain-containing sensor histidine kinase n=1 Tax=Nostoc sp. TCL26-01 TaxID=2576904 RepID=UPI0015BF7500|nr:PAS domain S-box protein [Nostoc sp. TCL26-01]QLE57988.1 PAS domain S-box protein [Nostoc sp. TCL26-01]